MWNCWVTHNVYLQLLIHFQRHCVNLYILYQYIALSVYTGPELGIVTPKFFIQSKSCELEVQYSFNSYLSDYGGLRIFGVDTGHCVPTHCCTD